ncbi:hypothetical protein ATANTOWER_004601 [Ataeniobius toweri]|uniref:Uncharacterized protein n=1 Tax=Ataeniobius toweri TaxID=208326 RepID=A0ABU7CHR8_9TELE|nr:hypothetical protein [Ataeniobius toweri]
MNHLFIKAEKSIRRIAFTCSFPASSLIMPHQLLLFTCLYKQHSGRQAVPDYRKPCDFSEPALGTSYIHLPSDFLTSTLLLPPDYHSLPNPWIRLPEPACPFMTLLLCPDR